MGEKEFWKSFDNIFTEMGRLFENLPYIQGKRKVTIVLTEDGGRRTFAISGQMSRRMIDLVREQMDVLESRIGEKSNGK